MLALVLLGAASCVAPRQSEPLTGPFLRDEPKVVRGQQIYAMRCAKCHPNGREGIGTQLYPVPEALFRLQVRTGLGQMPSFSSAVLSDKELDDLVAYYRAIRFRTMDER